MGAISQILFAIGRVFTQRTIFGFGTTGTVTAVTNLVSNTGVVAADTTGVGTARAAVAASTYGNDKAIFGYGNTSTTVSITNLVSNTGVVATDTTGVGTIRKRLAAASYGTDKAIFGYGNDTGSIMYSITNLVSNTGAVATDTTGVGTTRQLLGAATYGNDKAIFGYGQTTTSNTNVTAITNLVSNTGVVATDTTGVGTARNSPVAVTYGKDKALFAFGGTSTSGTTGFIKKYNLVSNTGVVATDTTYSGATDRTAGAGGTYGGDSAIIGFGSKNGAPSSVSSNITNLISNTGVFAAEVSGIGTARYNLGAAGYSLT
jgi:hypothetical protein